MATILRPDSPIRKAASKASNPHEPADSAQIATKSVRRRTIRRREECIVVAGDLIAVLVSTLVVADIRPALAVGVVVFSVVSVLAADRSRLALSVTDDMSRILAAVGVAVGIVLAVGSQLDAGIVRIAQVAVLVVLLPIMRAVAYLVIRRSRISADPLPAIVVGGGIVGHELMDTLEEHPEFGMRAIGVLDDVDDGPRNIGGFAELREVVTEREVGCVLVAFGPSRDSELVSVVREAVMLDIDVYVVPRFFDVGILPSGPRIESLWGIPVYRVRRAAHLRGPWPTKRLFDLVLTVSALIALSPILAVCALGVRLSSPGPIFFRQVRIGQHGREFEMFKFRSMKVNDDSDTQWSVVDDDRQTRFGNLIRRLSLDELPQLWNVVRGEMSIVGPRPERPYFVEQYAEDIDGYDDRHRLPVGLTGLAQVNGLRGDTSIEHRARIDNQYVEHWTPWLDLTVIARTVIAVASHARNDDF